MGLSLHVPTNCTAHFSLLAESQNCEQVSAILQNAQESPSFSETMNIIHTLIESWNWYRLKRKAKRSAKLTFQQLTEFHALIKSTKSISSHRATADDGAAEIRVARPVPGQITLNQSTN